MRARRAHTQTALGTVQQALPDEPGWAEHDGREEQIRARNPHWRAEHGSAAHGCREGDDNGSAP